MVEGCSDEAQSWTENKMELKPREGVQLPGAITGLCADGAGQGWLFIHVLPVLHSQETFLFAMKVGCTKG